jgi:hypothetical protein
MFTDKLQVRCDMSAPGWVNWLPTIAYSRVTQGSSYTCRFTLNVAALTQKRCLARLPPDDMALTRAILGFTGPELP